MVRSYQKPVFFFMIYSISSSVYLIKCEPLLGSVNMRTGVQRRTPDMPDDRLGLPNCGVCMIAASQE